MRTILITCGAAAVLIGSVPGIAWAGSSGRRNTAIAATAGAAIAWGRYYDAREAESGRPVKTVIVRERPPVVQREVISETRPVVQREVVYVYDDCRGKKHKHHKHRKCGECEHRGHHRHHDCDDDDD